MKKAAYTHHEEQRRGTKVRRENGGSELNLRRVAAALYGITGCDATAEQLEKAAKAAEYYRQGKSISLICLLLRIKPVGKQATRLPVERAEDAVEFVQPISLATVGVE